MNNWHGAVPRVRMASGKSGVGERGFNLIEKVFGAETAGLKAFVFSKSSGHTGRIGHIHVHSRGPDTPLPLNQRGILPAGAEPVHQAERYEMRKMETTSDCLSEKSWWNVTALKLNKAKSIINRIDG
jgi:hypothetical protein